MSLSFAALSFDYQDSLMSSAREIAAAKVTGGQLVEEFHEHFQPGNFGFSRVWTRVNEFIGPLPIVAVDAPIMAKTLEILWNEEGLTVPPLPYVCAGVVSERLTGLGSFSFSDYAETLGLVLPKVLTTLDRAVATAEILRIIAIRSDVSSVHALADKARIQLGEVSSTPVSDDN